MTETQEYLLTLTKATINNTVPKPPIVGKLDWNALITLAGHQDMLGILYPAVSNVSAVSAVPIMQDWRERITADGAAQAMLTDNLLITLRALNSSEIPYVVFKGIALKRLYPNPELRHMSDLDILTVESDVQKMEKALVKLGYRTMEDSRIHAAHIILKKQYSFPIELHRTLWNTDLHRNAELSEWQAHIWENKRTVRFMETDIPVLSAEDELVNLVIHFSNHLISANAALRQIYDIALLLRQDGRQMDFGYIFDCTCGLRLDTLLRAILELCVDYFELDPGCCGGAPCGEAGQLLIEDILSDYGIKGHQTYLSVSGRLSRHYMVENLKKSSVQLHLAEGYRKAKKLQFIITKLHDGHFSLGASLKITATVVVTKVWHNFLSAFRADSVYKKRIKVLQAVNLTDDSKNGR